LIVGRGSPRRNEIFVEIDHSEIYDVEIFPDHKIFWENGKNGEYTGANGHEGIGLYPINGAQHFFLIESVVLEKNRGRKGKNEWGHLYSCYSIEFRGPFA
jgi:hypothetical protein